MADLTEGELFDAFLSELDELHSWCRALYGEHTATARAMGEFYALAEREAKAFLESTWNTTAAEEYRAAHMPELQRLAAEHNKGRR